MSNEGVLTVPAEGVGRVEVEDLGGCGWPPEEKGLGGLLQMGLALATI